MRRYRSTITVAELGGLQSHPEYGAVAVRDVPRAVLEDNCCGDMTALEASIRAVGITHALAVVYEENGEEVWLRDGHHRAHIALTHLAPDYRVPTIVEDYRP